MQIVFKIYKQFFISTNSQPNSKVSGYFREGSVIVRGRLIRALEYAINSLLHYRSHHLQYTLPNHICLQHYSRKFLHSCRSSNHCNHKYLYKIMQLSCKSTLDFDNPFFILLIKLRTESGVGGYVIHRTTTFPSVLNDQPKCSQLGRFNIG